MPSSFFKDPAPTEISPLSLHDALPICGESVAEITTAILRDEPPTLSDSGRVVPVELDRVVMRCHEKKPEQRIQSARDLSFALRDLLSDSVLTKPTVAHPEVRTRTILWVQLAIGVVAIAALLLTLNVG